MAKQFVQRSRPMQKTWVGVNFGETALTITQAALGGIGFTVSSSSTVLRIRGSLAFKATPDAITDDDVVGIGLGIVTSDALAVGGTSIPGPLGDPDWGGWIWHNFVPFLAGASSGINELDYRVIEVDSKAMRKMKVNESLALIGQLATGNYSAIVVTGGLRVFFGEF